MDNKKTPDKSRDKGKEFRSRIGKLVDKVPNSVQGGKLATKFILT